MPERIVLLAGEREQAAMARFLRANRKSLDIVEATDMAGLERAEAVMDSATRLIAFCTAVIVPRRILDRLSGPAYNFHPGPPTYPGRYPESFAVYDGAQRFGATCHEMRERVDEGPIVGVEWFDVDPTWHRIDLANRAYRACIDLFARLGNPLANQETPLPPIAETWSGRKTRAADFTAMTRFDATISAEDLERRIRAFAPGSQGPLRLTLHGHAFDLVGSGDGAADPPAT